MAACSPTPAAKYEPPDERFVFFAQGKMDVLPEGLFAVGYVAALLEANPGFFVLVVGRGDARARPEASRDLGFRRAHAVRRVLVDHGIDTSRIQMGTPREQVESSSEQTGRRADMYVFDPKKEDVVKRVGLAVDVKAE